jgi:hypothetical protein
MHRDNLPWPWKSKVRVSGILFLSICLIHPEFISVTQFLILMCLLTS